MAPGGFAAMEIDGESSRAAPAGRREIWAWYGYDAAVAAFYSAALPIFFPLLLVALGSEFAWQQSGSQQPPACGGEVTSDCLQCVPGKGTQLLTSAGYTEAPLPDIPLAGGASINPVSFATAMLGVSVIFEVVAFVSVGPLADFGRGRKELLQVGTYMGAAACVLCLALASPALWWLAALLLILANVGYGIATVAYYSYLAVLVDASPEVQQAEAAGLPVQAVVEMREQVENRLSLTAVACASVASIVVTLLALAATLLSSSPDLKLRLALFLCGAWWLLLALPTFVFLKARPGPALPQALPSACSPAGTTLLLCSQKPAATATRSHFSCATSCTQTGTPPSCRSGCCSASETSASPRLPLSSSPAASSSSLWPARRLPSGCSAPPTCTTRPWCACL
ncbi:hypothetical protein CLOM_g15288 [Closterium sp. NIES-68]|nr:hypothetical protein CLOM_g15288 [Closterium sp. NIES-68]